MRFFAAIFGATLAAGFEMILFKIESLASSLILGRFCACPASINLWAGRVLFPWKLAFGENFSRSLGLVPKTSCGRRTWASGAILFAKCFLRSPYVPPTCVEISLVTFAPIGFLKLLEFICIDFNKQVACQYGNG